MFPENGRIILLAHLVSATLLTFVSTCRPGEYECSSVGGRTKCLLKSQLCDRKNDCHWQDDEKNCDVIPEVYVYCPRNYPKDGYYKDRTATCKCAVRKEDLDVHKGFAQWLKDGVPQDEPLKYITLMANTSEANQGYSCSGQSGYRAMNKGEVLKPKFAYLDKDMVMLEPTMITVCNRESSRQVTCKIPKENVNPAPTFSFQIDSRQIGEPLPAIETDKHYHQILTIPKEGVSTTSCTVTNTVFTLTQEITKFVTLRKPPPQPPMISVAGQSFQGKSSINIALLQQNFTGNLVCTLSGGYPEPRIGSLSCGDNIGFSKDMEGTVRFQNTEVTRAMHDVYCSCKAEHESGCYSNSETKVRLNVAGLASLSEKQSGEQVAVTTIIAIILAVVIVILLVVIVILFLRKGGQHLEQGSHSERVQLSEQKA